jgi:cytochrome c oxidase assembly factor CtaG
MTRAAWSLLAAYTGPPELTAVRGLTSWTLDLGGLVLVLALGLAYLAGLRRLAATGRRWPAGRVVAFVAGLVGIVLSTMSFLGVYEHTLFWVTAVQLALLLTVVPVLLVLGGPVSLLVAAVPAAEPRVERVLANPVVRVLTFPVVGAALVASVPVLVYFTPVFEASLRHEWLSWLLHAGVLAVGLVFFWSVISLDRESAVPYAALAAIVLVETLIDSVPGIVLWLGTGLVAGDYYRALGRPWGRSLLSDQRFGGVLLWGIGELVGLPLLLVVVVQWVRADAREAARVDRELDLAEQAERDGHEP